MDLKNVLDKVSKKGYLIAIISLCAVLCGIVFLVYFAALPTKSIVDKYSISEGTDTIISEKSGLGFKSVTFDNKNVPLLSYLMDETLNIDTEGEYIQSLNIGKLCISITGSYLNVNTTVTKEVLNDLLTKLVSEISNEDVELIKESKNIDIPYIITKNDDYVFIDFISYIPKNRNIAVYYRVIVQDVRTLDSELSETEYEILPESNLDEILNLIGLEDTSFLKSVLEEIGAVEDKTESDESIIEDESSIANETENVIEEENNLNKKTEQSVETEVEVKEDESVN